MQYNRCVFCGGKILLTQIITLDLTKSEACSHDQHQPISLRAHRLLSMVCTSIKITSMERITVSIPTNHIPRTEYDPGLMPIIIHPWRPFPSNTTKIANLPGTRTLASQLMELSDHIGYICPFWVSLNLPQAFTISLPFLLYKAWLKHQRGYFQTTPNLPHNLLFIMLGSLLEWICYQY